MKMRLLLSAALFAVLFGATSTPSTATAPAPLAVGLGPGSWISLEGTSTLHPYTSRSTKVVLAATRRGDVADPADAGALVELAKSAVVQGATLDVPVRTLLSGESGLDKNLWKTLKSDEYPRIQYRMASYEVAPAASPDSLRVRVEGTLEVAGVERPVPLDLTAARGAEGVVLEGTSALKMSDFGVKPPRLFLGALRVGDRIVVRYRLVVVPRKAGDETPATAGREVGRP